LAVMTVLAAQTFDADCCSSVTNLKIEKREKVIDKG
jgi:hypothetical protein